MDLSEHDQIIVRCACRRIAVFLPDPTLSGLTLERVAGMKRMFIGIAAATAVISPVCAQVASLGTPQPQWPPARYPATYPDPYSYRFVAPTPEDAYRQGLINRWELEQLEGPTPQALQGPSPDGSRSDPSR
jgi:hypothetical protein